MEVARRLPAQPVSSSPPDEMGVYSLSSIVARLWDMILRWSVGVLSSSPSLNSRERSWLGHTTAWQSLSNAKTFGAGC